MFLIDSMCQTCCRATVPSSTVLSVATCFWECSQLDSAVNLVKRLSLWLSLRSMTKRS